MHDESAHLPETLNNATAKASLHMFAQSCPSLRHWPMHSVPKGRADSNGGMVHINARNEGSEKSSHCTVNRFRCWLPFGFCIFQGALNGKMY